MRFLLALPGLAALVYGVTLLVPLADIPVGIWLVAGPLVHDLLLAPLIAVAGYAISRWASPPLLVGGAATGVLCLLAIPLLWRTYGTPPSPGLHDGDTWLGLGLTLAAVWLAVASFTLVTTWVDARKNRG
ncbi:hypothetical protein [Amycolatopsis magusensis]|uniref:hypothetical protein n=1 Tax=Amycolatopsis magusensis TaxID=882444 RepID=UPI003C2B9CA0